MTEFGSSGVGRLGTGLRVNYRFQMRYVKPPPHSGRIGLRSASSGRKRSTDAGSLLRDDRGWPASLVVAQRWVAGTGNLASVG